MGDLRAADRVRARGGDRAPRRGALGAAGLARTEGRDSARAARAGGARAARPADAGERSPAPRRRCCSPSTSAAARARTLVRVAREVARGRIDLHGDEHERAWRRLRAIPGVGPWTCEMLALYGQGRYDQVPAGDVGLLKLVGRMLSGGDPHARAQEQRGACVLRPLRRVGGLAAVHMMAPTWRAEDSVEPYARRIDRQ